MKVGFTKSDHALLMRATKKSRKKPTPFIREAALEKAEKITKGGAA